MKITNFNYIKIKRLRRCCLDSQTALFKMKKKEILIIFVILCAAYVCLVNVKLDGIFSSSKDQQYAEILAKQNVDPTTSSSTTETTVSATRRKTTQTTSTTTEPSNSKDVSANINLVDINSNLNENNKDIVIGQLTIDSIEKIPENNVNMLPNAPIVKNPAEEDSKNPAEEDSKNPAEEDSKNPAEEDSKNPAEEDSKNPAEEDSKNPAEEDSKNPAEEDSKNRSESKSTNALNVTANGLPLPLNCGQNETPLDSNGILKWPCIPGNDMSSIWPALLPHTESKKLTGLMLRFNNTDEKEQEFLMTQMEEQRKRTENVAAVCNRMPELRGQTNFDIVWAINRRPKVIYCPINKSASTTWMTYFLQMVQPDKREEIIENQYEIRNQVQLAFPLPVNSEEKLENFTEGLRFIVIKHPFIRFLSAYRDKVASSEAYPLVDYFKYLQESIIKHYRKNDSTIEGNEPTFSEFVDYFVDFTKDFKTLKDWNNMVVEWLPYWVQCSVCASDYEVIVKVETLQDDKRFLGSMAELQEIKDVDQLENLDDVPSDDLIEEYFGQLTTNQMHLLQQSFGPDFELFGYDINNYLQFAQDFHMFQI